MKIVLNDLLICWIERKEYAIEEGMNVFKACKLVSNLFEKDRNQWAKAWCDSGHSLFGKV